MKPARARFAFNATCTVLAFAVMSALGWFLNHMSTDFDAGFAAGGIGFTAAFLLLHKAGVRIF